MFSFLRLALPLLLVATIAPAVVLDQEALIEGHHLRLGISPDGGGSIETFALIASGLNMAAGEGIAQEGFGVGSYYVPNRRLNEKLEALDGSAGKPVIVYSYDCDGPNIKGLHVTRKMEPMIDESSVRVTWRIENKGTERQYVAPWVRHEASPGGTVGPEDRLDIPSLEGVVQPKQMKWYPAARNWAAVTDPNVGETFYCVFNADHLHSLMAIYNDERNMRGFQGAFVPRILQPGESWQTIYRINAVRGLKRVDFATDEFAAQFDYSGGTLAVLMAPVKSMPQVQMIARILAPNDRRWELPTKQFSLAPTKLVRASYPWDAPADGAYEFLAQLRMGDEVYDIGLETGSPHGGVDTQFFVGSPKTRSLEPWTDAPFALDLRGRELQRQIAAKGPGTVWFESPLFKVYESDSVRSTGSAPVRRVTIAKGERESFQVCVRADEKELFDVQASVGEFSGAPGLSAKLYRVGYVDVRIPSHFEGPTGRFPDPLPPLTGAFKLSKGATAPIWITVAASPDTPAGTYRAPLRIQAADLPAAELTIEVRVFDFALPKMPSLKTDFGFWSDSALAGSKTQGGKASAGDLGSAYLDNAFEHRVTLRELVSFPRETSDYARALGNYEPFMRQLLESGATTLSIPASLVDQPEQLAAANDFVKKHNLQKRAFVQLSHEPLEPAFSKLLESMDRWKKTAPDIPIMVTTFGMQPFIPEHLDIWALHAQTFDTVHNKQIIDHISKGNEAWWYVNHTPPRPYGNFLLDFAAIEHRILFWHTWALGLRGMHYWGVNYFPEGDDPYRSLLDLTPVNGDGCLVYPGPNGPIDSIRWECIRDGIEDYDYLSMFMERMRRLQETKGNEALLARAQKAYDIGDVIPSLVNFTREPGMLERKREEIGGMIEEMERALK